MDFITKPVPMNVFGFNEQPEVIVEELPFDEVIEILNLTPYELENNDVSE